VKGQVDRKRNRTSTRLTMRNRKRVNLDQGLGGGGKVTLGTLGFCEEVPGLEDMSISFLRLNSPIKDAELSKSSLPK
jgi:hypothetical protein